VGDSIPCEMEKALGAEIQGQGPLPSGPACLSPQTQPNLAGSHVRELVLAVPLAWMPFPVPSLPDELLSIPGPQRREPSDTCPAKCAV
jgi:hypothetical protein